MFIKKRVFALSGVLAIAASAAAQNTAPAPDLSADVQQQLTALTETYKHLHRNPEPSRHEEKTSAFLAEELRKLGYSVTEHVGRYTDGSATHSHARIEALRRGMGETTYGQVRACVEARLASGEFQLVPGQKHNSARQFTTEKTIKAEKEVLRRMRQGQGRVEQIMPVQQAVAHTPTYPHLNFAQRAAAEEILTSRDVVQGLHGSAGAGKTSTLKAVREAAEQRGFIVEGFAPTSRAARQLRDAGISADTLQGFLARSRQPGPKRHLYMVDESSLASTKQVRDFLGRLDSGDRVLFIGDTRQHQGVEAGKPFEQLVNAGMRTAKLDQIVRQKDPDLLRAVEHLSRGEVAEGIALLEQQGRVTEIADPQKRIASIARNYADSPGDTIIVSPDNASRREINQAVRSELQARGVVASDNHSLRVLVPRSDMTGADRAWAARYQIGDVLHYQRGSTVIGIEPHSYMRVISTDPKTNSLTVEKADGRQITYDPSRLHGISAYREIEREFAVRDRLQFTAPSKELGIANRDLGTVQQMGRDGTMTVRMDGGNDRTVTFDPVEMRHFDHGYAVTSHSAQGLTGQRVLIHADTSVHPDLLSSRFGYVAVSRASHEAMIFTDGASRLVQQLGTEVTKTAALEIGHGHSLDQGISV